MTGFTNILVAVDFDEHDNILLQNALRVASKFNSKIWVVHVATPDPDFVGYEVGPQYIRDSRADDLKKEHRILKQYREDLIAEGVEADALLIQGPTVQAILDEAIKLQVDLFIVGTHKHGFLHRLFNVNAPLELAKESNIPLMIIPLD